MNQYQPLDLAPAGVAEGLIDLGLGEPVADHRAHGLPADLQRPRRRARRSRAIDAVDAPAPGAFARERPVIGHAARPVVPERDPGDGGRALRRDQRLLARVDLDAAAGRLDHRQAARDVDRRGVAVALEREPRARRRDGHVAELVHEPAAL